MFGSKNLWTEFLKADRGKEKGIGLLPGKLNQDHKTPRLKLDPFFQLEVKRMVSEDFPCSRGQHIIQKQ